MKSKPVIILLILLTAFLAAPQAGEKGFLGVALEDNEGVLTIGHVVPKSAAEAMGLELYDQVLSVNGTTLKAGADFSKILGALSAGDKVELTVIRKGEKLNVSGTLGTRPKPKERPSMVGQKAPAWDIEKWGNLPEGKSTLDVSDFAGQVVVVHCFQSWCPGCHEQGLPNSQALEKTYQNDDRIAFVQIQTVFEGFHRNTFEKGQEDLDKLGLNAFYGHTSGSKEDHTPAFMDDYHTGGTPWHLVIDHTGTIIWANFSPELNEIETVVAEAVKKVPASTPN